MVMTRRMLARHLGGEQASGRIQHWTEIGLLETSGEKAVGRGRARFYDDDAAWRVVQLAYHTDRGATAEQLRLIVSCL